MTDLDPHQPPPAPDDEPRMEAGGLREPADEPVRALADATSPTEIPRDTAPGTPPDAPSDAAPDSAPDAAPDASIVAPPADAWGPPLEAAPASWAIDEPTGRAPEVEPLAQGPEEEPTAASASPTVPETTSSGMGIGVILGIVVALVIVGVMAWLLILSPGTTLT